jgi:hypothetical protein
MSTLGVKQFIDDFCAKQSDDDLRSVGKAMQYILRHADKHMSCVLPLHPEGLTMKYTYEWPKTAKDYIFALGAHKVDNIVVWSKDVNGQRKTTGVQLIFPDDKITIGHVKEGEYLCKLQLNDRQKLKHIKVSQNVIGENGENVRQFFFYDGNMNEIDKWKGMGGLHTNTIAIYGAGIAKQWRGKHV